MDDKERKYLMTRRQCLIMELGAIEDMLDMERSIVPKRKRDRVDIKDMDVVAWAHDLDLNPAVATELVMAKYAE